MLTVVALHRVALLHQAQRSAQYSSISMSLQAGLTSRARLRDLTVYKQTPTSL